MKKSAALNHWRMRKSFALKPLAVIIGSLLLTSCGNNAPQTATVYTNVDECKAQNPDNVAACETAFQQATQEAEKTAPRYTSKNDCENEFGADRCQQYGHNNGQGGWFSPFMAGYLFSRILSPGYYPQPMFMSTSPYSSNSYRWLGADGRDLGDVRDRNLRVNKDAMKPKPAVNNTISRGGFGSTVRAKSSWGSSSKGKGG
jgi:uncharacterized protein YgiB involved in biofilm formation